MARILVTIPVSHYCEKARWALDRSGQAYVERRHLPGLHALMTRRAGGGATAPVFVCEDGVLAESAEIVAWASERSPRPLAPGAEAITALCDETLGPATRLWVYGIVSGDRDILQGAIPGVPGWERSLFALLLPVMGPAIRRRFRISPTAVADAEREIDAVFDAVAAALDGNAYLGDGGFGVADLTFAALAAPAVGPPEYGIKLPDVSELPAPGPERAERWRAHPAGAHALRMYREHRW